MGETLKSATGKEKNILAALIDVCGVEAVAYYILWKYMPELLPNGDEVKTFEDLQKHSSRVASRTQKNLENALYTEKAQAGIKYLLRRMDVKRDTDLLNRYYSLAMSGDVQALKAYMDFKKRYFADGNVDELKQIISNVNIAESGDDDDEDFEMNLG